MFDFDQIDTCVRWIRESAAGWAGWFARNRLEPFPVARINRSRRWRRRHSVLTGLLAAASGAAAFVLTREVGAVPLPW